MPDGLVPERSVTGESSWRPERLRCELLEGPIGVGARRPRLQWRLPEEGSDAAQSAYRVVIVDGSERGAEERLWDSGWVESAQSGCRYGGDELCSRQQLEWRVQLRTAAGGLSHWSEAARFEMGLLEPTDWTASWVRRAERGRRPPDRRVDVFRTYFTVESPPSRARLYSTALGVYELYISAERVGDALLRPGWTNARKRVQYQVADVTGLLRPGKKVLFAVLAPGWFAGKISSRVASEDASHPDIRAAELLVQLEFDDEGGRRTTICTDESWQWAESAIVSSDLYDGEDWDLRLLDPRALAAAEGGGHWEAVELSTGTAGQLSAVRTGPVRIIETRPALVEWRPDGTALIDSGKNDAGYLRLRVDEPRGRRVELLYGEVLDPAGNLYRENLRSARCADSFVCSGAGEEVLEPSFSYRGFRYAEVRGSSGPAHLLDAEAVAIGSELERTGWFRSSSRLLEQIYELMVCSLQANYIEVPTDCPQRDERLGWMADALLFAPVAAYTFDINSFLSKWFDDVLDARTHVGGFSDIAPRMSARWTGRPPTGAPAWADAGVLLPWLVYERYGDEEVLERLFPAMRTWLDVVHGENPDGIWRVGRGRDYGDWVPLGPDTSHDLFSTCWLYRSTVVAGEIARLLGQAEVADELAGRAERVRRAFAEHYVDAASGRVSDPSPKGSPASARHVAEMAEETQTGYVVALALELLDGEVARRAGARLAQLVVGSGGRLETGFAGSAFLLSALEGAGYPELAYDLLLRTSPPSLGFMVAMGATSVWERWDGLSSSGAPASPIMNSFNHYAMSSMLSWLVEGVCGFRPVPGVPSLCEVRFAPAVSARVRDASFEFEAPLGRVVTSWAWRTDDEIEGSVRVPLGMRCTIAGTIAVDGAWARALGSGHVGSTDRVVGGGVHEVRWHLEQPATPGAACSEGA